MILMYTMNDIIHTTIETIVVVGEEDKNERLKNSFVFVCDENFFLL